MTSATIVVLIAAGYLLASLVIGWLPSRRASNTATGYVAGDRTLGPLLMYFITGATIFSAFAFLGGPGWAYSRGAAALYILGYGTLGFLPFYFLGPRAARVGHAYGFVSPGEMVAHRFRWPLLAGAMALISAIAFVPYLALQMKGAGYVLEAVTRGKLPGWMGALVVYTVVTLYVVRSGVLGVGWTNTFQGLFMMALAWIMGIYLPYKLYGGLGPMFEQIEAQRPELLQTPGLNGQGTPWAATEYASAILVSAIGFSAWPHVFMKAFTARDESTIRRTVVLYPTFQLFLLPLLIIGFAGVLFASAPTKPDQILPHMLMNLELSPVLVGLFCAGALAASMSSGDAIAHACSSILVRDGWIRSCNRSLAPAAERRWIRLLLPLIMAAAYTLAMLYQGSLVGLLLYAYGPITQLMPVLVATLYCRKVSGSAALTGLVTGILVNLLFVLQPDWRPLAIHAGLYGLAANVAAMTLTSHLSQAGESEAFLQVAQGNARQARD
jgi:SSS family solute:Na+ symporter